MVARNSNPRVAPRGPAAQRRAARADRDGDVSMGVSIKGQGRVGKGAAPPSGPRKDGASKTGRGGILSATAQRAILRQAGASDVSMKNARPAAARGGGLVELKVTGWQKSKVSDSADGGVSSLLRWMEKKASTKLGSRVRSVKIRKVRRRQHANRRTLQPTCRHIRSAFVCSQNQNDDRDSILGQRLPYG